MNQVNRRNFLRLAGAGAAAAAAAPVAQAMGAATATAASVVNPENADRETQQDKPDTNIADAAKIARGPNSMPGLYPGRVVMVKNSRSVRDNLIVEQEVYDMIARSMLELTGEKKTEKGLEEICQTGRKNRPQGKPGGRKEPQHQP